MNWSIRKQLTINTLTNYIYLITHLSCSLYLTRIIYLNMDHQSYGFWQLLWMVFGFSLLLDFGFGVTIQKYTAAYINNKDAGHLGQVLSAVLLSYLLMAIIIIAGTISVAPHIDQIFSFEATIDTDKLDTFKRAFILFGIGTALIFPFGIFAEILHGLGRLDLKNYMRIGERLLYTVGVYAVFAFNWSIIELVTLSIVVNLLLNLLMAIVVFKKIPNLKINLFKFNLMEVKPLISFSFFSYIIIIANLIIIKADHIVLGISLGMGSIAIYHIGSRLAHLLTNISSQFQASLTPVAALLYHKGEMTQLRQVLLHSNRISVYITTGFFLLFVMLLDPILYLWLKVTSLDEVVYEVAIIMLLSVFVHSIIKSTTDKFMIMAGKHKSLAYITVFEAILNLVLSIILIKYWGTLGVALGTLIPNVLVSIFIFYPIMCSFGNVKKDVFFMKVYWPTLLTAIPAILVLWIFTKYIFPIDNLILWEGWPGLLRLSCCTAVTMVTYLSTGFYLVLNLEEKCQIKHYISKALSRKN